MRLCVISHAYLEEGYRHVLETLALHPDVTLAWFTPDRYRLAMQTSSGELGSTSTHYQTYALPIRWGGRQGTFVYQAGPLAAALEDFKPDIILHEQEVFALGAGQVAFIARRRGIPMVPFVNENLYRKLAWPRRWLRDYVLARSSGLIPISQMAARVHRDWGFHGPLAVLPQMGVTMGVTPSSVQSNPGVLQVCFAGRLVELKGVECLIQAVALTAAKGVRLTCTIAGRGENRAHLEDLIKQLGINEIVRFAGMLPPAEMTALLQASDVLVLPSQRSPVWEEQFGRILVEAMAQAVVTVGTHTGAIPEVIHDEALLFEQDDSAGLALILERLATDDAFRNAQQQRLYQRALELYETGIVTERKVAFLKSVLDSQEKRKNAKAKK